MKDSTCFQWSVSNIVEKLDVLQASTTMLSLSPATSFCIPHEAGLGLEESGSPAARLQR